MKTIHPIPAIDRDGNIVTQLGPHYLIQSPDDARALGQRLITAADQSDDEKLKRDEEFMKRVKGMNHV